MGLARWFRWLRGERQGAQAADAVSISCMGDTPMSPRESIERITENTPVGHWDGRVPPHAQPLLARAVQPYTLSADGRYTQPRSFGVYEVVIPGEGVDRFHFGNHPVRQRELVREHGETVLIALYLDRDDAESLCRALRG